MNVETKVEETVSVVMYDESGLEKDVTFKKVTTLGQYPPKWYDEAGVLQDKDISNKLELCYSNRPGNGK